LGGGVVPSSDFRFSLGDPFFGVGGFAIQKATPGARVTLMVVPKVKHLQDCSRLKANFRISSAVSAFVQHDKKTWNFRSIMADKVAMNFGSYK
jgi:hypothetical protein